MEEGSELEEDEEEAADEETGGAESLYALDNASAATFATPGMCCTMSGE